MKPSEVFRPNQMVPAAISWWKGHRPVGWTERQHLENPTVNCPNPREKRLAREVAAFVRVKRFADGLVKARG